MAPVDDHRGRTPDFGPGIADLRELDFDKATRDSYLFPLFSDGVVAQLVEHHNGIVGVRGSNPLGSTILRRSATASVWLRRVVAEAKDDPL